MGRFLQCLQSKQFSAFQHEHLVRRSFDEMCWPCALSAGWPRLGNPSCARPGFHSVCWRGHESLNLPSYKGCSGAARFTRVLLEFMQIFSKSCILAVKNKSPVKVQRGRNCDLTVAQRALCISFASSFGLYYAIIWIAVWRGQCQDEGANTRRDERMFA